MTDMQKIGKWIGLAVVAAAAACMAQDEEVEDGQQVRLVRGENAIRQLIEQSLHTQYCGFAMAEAGIGPIPALTGKSPLGTGGFAKAEEDDWLPVAIRMGEEDLERLKALHDDLFPESHDSDRTPPAIREQIDSTFDHLSRLTMLLGHADGHASEVLDFLETVDQTKLPGMPCGIAERLGPPQVGYWRVWVRLSDLDSEEGIARCLSAGEKYAAEYGFGSQGNLAFCVQWLKEAAPRCHWEKGYARGARHVLKSIGHFGQHRECYMLDCAAADGGLAGWKDSLQRRQMAERFRNTTPPKVPRWNEARQQEEMAIYEEMWPFMLSRRAAAELAADEKDLTDLRKVYGAWEANDDVTGTSSPLPEP